MDNPSKWEDYLNLVEFSYTNGHQASLGTSQFEAFYDRGYMTPFGWDNPMNMILLGLEMLMEMEQQIGIIR